MRLTIAAVPVVIGSFDLAIKEPHVVRAIYFQRKKALVMTKGQPDFEEVPMFMIESSPDRPVKKRRYQLLKHGDIMELAEYERATWVATSEGMFGILHAFEITEVEA